NIPLAFQLDELKEDLLQIEYESGYILDVGWYPEFKLKGCFKIFIVKPNEKIYEKKTRSIKKLRLLIKEAVELIGESLSPKEDKINI
ncbi:MAG: hypothetical protein K2G25_06840, partial [Oscillospiraceae bacterium]|nr:hypothetical protein [Oscillospiraceae bacterium]